MLSLTAQQRSRVMQALPGTGDEAIYCYSTVLKRALQLGIVSKNKGRDTRTQAESRATVLREWIAKLYKAHKNLPEMPDKVKAAYGPSNLDTLMGGLAKTAKAA